MIERVMKAVEDAINTCPGEGNEEGPDWFYHDDGPINRRAVVRAVLQAIREPTEEMIGTAVFDPLINASPTDAARTWRAMIDEALKECVSVETAKAAIGRKI